jgi:peptidoglycan/xylan/chitin deacetylase (PgdA/CDA1 family)
VSQAYFSELQPFLELFSRGLPILMYHKVGNRPRGARLKGLYISEKLFCRQMNELVAAGFTSSSLKGWENSPSPKHRPFVITFDDAFTNVFENALPILEKLKLKAMLYVVSSLVGKRNEWDLKEGEVSEPLMDASQIREWLQAGHEIGSHSVTHARLTRLSVRDAREEISGSRKALEDRFQISVKDFCYPYGDFSPGVRDLVIESGYDRATTTQFGVNAPGESSFELKRIMARYRSRSLKNLKLGLNGFKLNH